MSHVDTSAAQGAGASQDFDLNLAPIIDCFVVLISFLLISSSFLAIGLLDAGVQAGSLAPAADSTPPPVRVTVELGSQHQIKVSVEGQQKGSWTLAASGQEWNWKELTQQLDSLKKKWTSLDGAVLTAQPDVSYKNIVQGLDVMRKTLPNVLLGEF